MPKGARRRPVRRLLRWSGLALGGWLVASILAVLVLRFVHPPLSAVMAREWIDARLAGDRTFSVDYRWTPWDHVSPAVPAALVAAEDQTFPRHHGFDIASIQDALATADAGGRLRGASTISQQVAKNLFLWNGRSFVRKGLEAWFTVLIEALWPKRRILEMYLNIAEFGHGIYGVDAASERFFHASPARLDGHHAALLAAVLPNPARLHAERPSPYVLQRARWIERQVRQLGSAARVDD